jgi:hypothetical protein
MMQKAAGNSDKEDIWIPLGRKTYLGFTNFNLMRLVISKSIRA